MLHSRAIGIIVNTELPSQKLDTNDLRESLYGQFKSHQRCSAGIRPVKFFHTDWIIISLWFLSYTQRHCHVRIEKSPNCWYTIRFPRISLYASTLRFILMEITKEVQPYIRRGCQYFWQCSVCSLLFVYWQVLGSVTAYLSYEWKARRWYKVCSFPKSYF